jgi:hypothetical protein
MDRFSEEHDAEFMDAAAEYIEKNGWWRGALIGPNGKQACAVGAIIYGSGMNQTRYQLAPYGALRTMVHRVSQKVLKVLNADRDFPKEASLENWNDGKLSSGARDRQEVIDLFRKAAKVERAGFDPDQGVEL